MAQRTREQIAAALEVIRTEPARGGNTRERMAGLLRDISDSAAMGSEVDAAIVGGRLSFNGSQTANIETASGSGLSSVLLTGRSAMLSNQPRQEASPTRLVDYAGQAQNVAVDVQTLYDTGTLRQNATQAAAGNRVSVVADANGEHVMRFVRATPTHYDASFHLRAQKAVPFSLTARFKLNSLAQDGNIVGMYGAGNELFQFYVSATNQPWLWTRDGASVLKQIFWPTAIVADREYVMTGIIDGINSALLVDGVCVPGDLSGLTTQVWTGSKIGAANAAAANPISADVYRIVQTPGALSIGQYRALFREVAKKPCLRLIFDGNSITAGQGTELYTMPDHVAIAIGASTVAIDNIAVGAATTSARMTNWVAQALPKIHPYAETVAIIAETTNAIYYGADAATAAAQTWEWCRMYRAAGVKVVLWDVIARQSFTAPQRAIALEANALLAANAHRHCDAFVKASEAFPDYTDNELYEDGTHLRNAGYSRLANLIVPYIKQVAAIL